MRGKTFLKGIFVKLVTLARMYYLETLPLVCFITILIPHPMYASNVLNTSFTGKEYIEYKIHNSLAESRKDKVTLRIKTWQAYGVLLYSCGMQGDFLLLEMKRGKLV